MERPPESLVLQVDYTLRDFDGDDLADVLLNLAAHQLVDRVIAGDGLVGSRFAQADEREIIKGIRERLSELATLVIERELDGYLRPMIQEAMERQFDTVDENGMPTGDRARLREVIARRIEAQIQLRDGSRRSSFGGSNPSLLEKLIHDQVDTVLRSEVTKTIESAKAKVNNVVKEEASTIVAKALERLAK